MHNTILYGIHQPLNPLDRENPPGGLPRLKNYLPMPKCKPPKEHKDMPMAAIQILCKLRDMGVTEEMVVESGILKNGY